MKLAVQKTFSTKAKYKRPPKNGVCTIVFGLLKLDMI